MNDGRLVAAWVQLVGMLLVAVTLLCFRKTTANLSIPRRRLAYAGGWLLFFLLPIPLFFGL